MTDVSSSGNPVQYVTSFQELVATPFSGAINAICWSRTLKGDFSEIVEKIVLNGNITEIGEEELRELSLSEQGQFARAVLLNDWQLLKDHGASPSLNVIKYYEEDDSHPFFPTDVYSFHVDRSPVPTDTFLCTYHGASGDLLPNAQAQQKILIPEIRKELQKLYQGAEEGFDAFLKEHFFDLHYEAKPGASPVNLGLGQLWRLAVDHPQSQVLPCIHRAPREKPGQSRLLMIC